MDYSFERAFTMQEKECMLAYKVSELDTITNEHHIVDARFQNSIGYQLSESGRKRPSRVGKGERRENKGVSGSTR